jgi:hypothetical protein
LESEPDVQSAVGRGDEEPETVMFGCVRGEEERESGGGDRREWN